MFAAVLLPASQHLSDYFHIHSFVATNFNCEHVVALIILSVSVNLLESM